MCLVPLVRITVIVPSFDGVGTHFSIRTRFDRVDMLDGPATSANVEKLQEQEHRRRCVLPLVRYHSIILLPETFTNNIQPVLGLFRATIWRVRNTTRNRRTAHSTNTMLLCSVSFILGSGASST